MAALKRFFRLTVYVINTLLALGILGLFAGHDIAVLDYANIGINYLPKWLLLVPFSFLIFCLRPLTKFNAAVLGSVLLLFLWFQDYQLNIPNRQAPADLSVLTLNAGNGTNPIRLRELVAEYLPDIVLLQESSNKLLGKIFDATWLKHCVGHLCIASRLEFKFEKQYSRKMLGGWGNFVSSYKLSVRGNTVALFNVHLETPRPILMGMLHGYFGNAEIQAYNLTKSLQSQIVSALLDKQPFSIVGGDFNTTVFEYQYRTNLAKFNNAISDTAFGLNYTKKTAWHGARIDHLLSNEGMMPVYATLLPSVGGDHLPIFARFMLN